MIINCLLISIKSGESINNLHPSLAWIGLLNWLPFFWIFWSFQTYLKNNLLRIQAARLFIIGSLPVLFSGFTQYFLKWYGPYELFNRLIIWYQRPLGDDNGVQEEEITEDFELLQTECLVLLQMLIEYYPPLRGELDIPEEKWLCDQLFADNTLTVLTALQKAGKSAFVSAFLVEIA